MSPTTTAVHTNQQHTTDALARVAKGKHVVGEQREKLTDQLCIWYAEGHSLRELAERTGRSYQTIRNMLTEAGVTMRPRGGVPSGGRASAGMSEPARTRARALGAELLRLRRARGWTRGQTVRKLGISTQTLATYETGATTPAPARLAELCAVLDTEPARVIAAAERTSLGRAGGFRHLGDDMVTHANELDHPVH